jgi:2-keto-4-pentenoate hydratase/2-oxohepta-3-ene-1,7-dioic acid hydratase in catechol pathway
MKLLRYGELGEEAPGLLDGDGNVRSLAGHVSDIDGAALAPGHLAALRRIDPETLPLVAGVPRLGVPVAGIGKIIEVGLNYTDQAAEVGKPLPDEPILFAKAVTALNGPNDPVVLPEGARKADWEVKLAVVIGRTARSVGENEALDHVAGYVVMNDLSERAWQFERGGQWIKGKSFDTFAPLGPWLVTRDEVPDPQNLRIWLRVNGVMRQDSHTTRMNFGVASAIAYISRCMTLLPGDVITTGTPAGIGNAAKPPLFLKPGDVIELGVEGLGEQRQEVYAWERRGT